MDLDAKIDKGRSAALNLDDEHPLANLFNNDFDKHLRSDADDQLIVYFHFLERVKLSGFSIQAEGADTQPEVIKIFVNTTTLDFSDCESLPADFEADVSKENLKEQKVRPLNVAKFTGVDSLTFFVESSVGGEVAAISSLKFFGAPVAGTNMNELKKNNKRTIIRPQEVSWFRIFQMMKEAVQWFNAQLYFIKVERDFRKV